MKRVFILMMSISAVFMGCSKANEPQGDAGWGGNTEPKENLVVMSYNIKHCAPYYGVSGETTTADVNNVANVIKAKARCSLLQEVDYKTTRSLGVDQAKELAELAGYSVLLFFQTKRFSRRGLWCSYPFFFSNERNRKS